MAKARPRNWRSFELSGPGSEASGPAHPCAMAVIMRSKTWETGRDWAARDDGLLWLHANLIPEIRADLLPRKMETQGLASPRRSGRLRSLSSSQQYKDDSALLSQSGLHPASSPVTNHANSDVFLP
ncbi:hypothetical protein VTK26DRAFT_2424 [Humicola hyalothermophila]